MTLKSNIQSISAQKSFTIHNSQIRKYWKKDCWKLVKEPMRWI